MMNVKIWKDLYNSARMPKAEPVFTGFNANLDRVIMVTADLLVALKKCSVLGSKTLLNHLLTSMQNCRADEWFVNDPVAYQTISDLFSRTGTVAIGGQAGISAAHLRRLGMPDVTCALQTAGPQTRAMLQNTGVKTLLFDPSGGDQGDIFHLIFEFGPSLVPVTEGVVPRSNRFIASPDHDPSSVLIPDHGMDNFLEKIASCRRAFLSGYQYLRKEPQFKSAARQIRIIQKVNPLMRTHVECVSIPDWSVLAMMLRHIIPNTDSIGLNEHELGLLMDVAGGIRPDSAGISPSSPVECIRNAIALADATGVHRIHLHTYGFYVLILDLMAPKPENSRNALLFAARVTADMAGGDKQILSPEGLSAYAAVQKEFGPDRRPGIFSIDKHTVILVPTYISQHINKTTGLGDILSSTAFVVDRF